MNDSQSKRLNYVYEDEEGDSLYLVYRKETPDGAKTHYVLRPDGSKGFGSRRVFYRLPELLKANTVIIVEGERKADALSRHTGRLVTCAPSGSKGPRHPQLDYTALVRTGLDIAIWRDVGLGGESWERDLYGRLRDAYDDAGLDLRIRFVQPPVDAKTNWDCRDAVRDCPEKIETLLTKMLSEAEWRKKYFKNKFQPEPIAREIIEAVPPLLHTHEQFYMWEKTAVWRPIDERLIRGAITNRLGAGAKTAHVSDVLGIMKDLLHETDAFKKDREPKRIYVANGDIVLEKHEKGWVGEFEEPDPETRTRVRSPVSYVRDEALQELDGATPFKEVIAKYGTEGPTCPAFLRFLLGLFRDDDDRDQKIRFVQQWFGYSLYRRNPFPLVTFFVGEGANGKSELLRVLEALVGSESTAHLSLKDVSERFRLIRLDGKLVNIPHEVGQGTLIDDGLLKTLADGAYMPVEEKGKPVYEAGLFAKHVFATNHAPHCRDVTHGMLRRLRVIEFNRRFTDDEIIPEFAKSITGNPLEMAGVLRWALDGLLDLLNWNGLLEPASSKEIVDRWRIEWDSVAGFIKSECYLDPRADVAAKNFFVHYRDWATQNGFRPFSVRVFVQRVRLLTGIEAGHQRTGNYYLGIGLNTEHPDLPINANPVLDPASSISAMDQLVAMMRKEANEVEEESSAAQGEPPSSKQWSRLN